MPVFLKKYSLRFYCWILACLFILYLFFKQDLFKEILNLDYIFGGYHVSPWGVLFLCFLVLILKKDEIKGNLQAKVSPVFAAGGIVLAAVSFLIPEREDFVILKFLTACLGLFSVFFGRAALLPSKLLAVYAFTVLMPLGVERYFERPYALSAAIPASAATRLLGLPVAVNDQILTVKTIAGESISVIVTGACAGPATMAVFTAIFLLMMMDMKLPDRAAAAVFLFGAAGTWLQNVVRIVIIMAFGRYGGAPALWKAHFWTIYILFPVWYVIFAAVYFKVLNMASPRRAQYSQRRA